MALDGYSVTSIHMSICDSFDYQSLDKFVVIIELISSSLSFLQVIMSLSGVL